MLFKTYLAAGAMASGALAGAMKKPVRCSAPEMTEERKLLNKQFALQEAEVRANGAFAVQADIPVRVYLHTVSAKQSTLLSDATLRKQMDVLTADFAGTGFQLTLANTTKTVNSVWARDGNEMAMKQKLRQGNYRDLNLYFVDSMSGLGYCYFPTTAPKGSDAFIRDGCTNIASSVPGGKAPFDLGKTAVHESGHWFGLEHTFQGGCSAPGDGVDDTPAQESSTSGCPVGRDSCPNQPGLDPIHNYMDYSDDSCYEEFTAGQKARMKSYWTRFRAGK